MFIRIWFENNIPCIKGILSGLSIPVFFLNERRKTLIQEDWCLWEKDLSEFESCESQSGSRSLTCCVKLDKRHPLTHTYPTTQNNSSERLLGKEVLLQRTRWNSGSFVVLRSPPTLSANLLDRKVVTAIFQYVVWGKIDNNSLKIPQTPRKWKS